MIYKEELQQIKRTKIEVLLKDNNYPEDLANFFRYSSVKSQVCLLGYFSSINNFLNWCKQYLKISMTLGMSNQVMLLNT